MGACGTFFLLCFHLFSTEPHPPSLPGMTIFLLQDGWSPLVVTSLNGHLCVVKGFIKAGANVKVSDTLCERFVFRRHSW